MIASFPQHVALADILAWLWVHLTDPGNFVQIVIILFGYGVGALSYRLMRQNIVNAIDRSELPAKVKRIFNNLKRTFMYVIMLVVVFILSQIAKSLHADLNPSLSEAAMKVISAWIIVRMALQFMDNAFLRNIFAVLILSIMTLSIFGVLSQTSDALDEVGFNIGHFRFSALSIVKGGMSLFILLYLALFLSAFIERAVLRTKSLSRSSQVLLVKIIRITLIIFAVFIGVSSAGIDLSVFTVFSGAIGLGLGFGLQKVASNLFSGLLLLTDKSINPGDIIELEGGTFGWVNHMGARYTEVVTRDNKSYLIPNEDFITQRIVNWSHGNRLVRLHVPFAVHYRNDPHRIIDLAKAAARGTNRVVTHPEPMCWISKFGENAVEFDLRFWIKDPEQGVFNMRGAVMLQLWDSFKKNGISFAYPQREVFLHHMPEPSTPP